MRIHVGTLIRASTDNAGSNFSLMIVVVVAGLKLPQVVVMYVVAGYVVVYVVVVYVLMYVVVL